MQKLYRLVLLSGLFGVAAGCGSSASESRTVAESGSSPTRSAATDVPFPTPVLPTTPVKQTAPTTQPTPTPSPVADLGSKVVAKSLTPGAVPAPDLPATKAPKPRTSDLDRAEFPLPKSGIAPAPLPPATAKPPKPTPPPEAVPLGLGIASTEDLSAIKAKEKTKVSAPSPVNPGAADVPPLVRQVPDRASLEDPTADITRVRTVETVFPLPVGSAPVLRIVIPDPFEFQEHLKQKLPERPEFGSDPQRVSPGK